MFVEARFTAVCGRIASRTLARRQSTRLKKGNDGRTGFL